MLYDYLIVGQGIAGSVLGFQLLAKNKKCIIFDIEPWNSPSRISNGIVNPITGQKYVKTWLFDELNKSAKPFYKYIEQLLGIKIYHETFITKLFPTALEANEFDLRITDLEYVDYLEPSIVNGNQKIKGTYTGKIKNVFWINTNLFIEYARKYFLSNFAFKEENFDYLKLKKNGEVFNYQDFSFRKIVFCEGAKGIINPYFPNLPFVFAKGELISIEFFEEMGQEIIQKNGILSPIGIGQYKFGSTNSWSDINPNPTQEGRTELEDKLKQITDLPFKIKKHFAAIRPTTKDRRPLLGESNIENNIYIMNGLGTKGVSLAPYFSNMLIDFMEYKTPILPTVNWNRFEKKIK